MYDFFLIDQLYLSETRAYHIVVHERLLSVRITAG